jgi:hypothetical protein
MVGFVKAIISELNINRTSFSHQRVTFLSTGICCGSEKGWITITDAKENVLYSAAGDYSYVAVAYLFLNSNGSLELTASYPEHIPEGTMEPSTFGWEETTSVPTGVSVELSVSSPTPAPVAAAINPPTRGPTNPPTRGPTNFPTLATVGSVGCDLCPGGASVGSPFTEFETEDGATFTCGDVEAVYLSMTDAECADFQNNGLTELYQCACDCPGVFTCPESECELCLAGDSVGEPNYEFFTTSGAVFTCDELESAYLTFDDVTCGDVEDNRNTDLYRKLCHCPGFEPDCFLCPNGLPDPFKEFQPLEDGTVYTCNDWYVAYLFFDSGTCFDFDSEGITASFEDYCEC